MRFILGIVLCAFTMFSTPSHAFQAFDESGISLGLFDRVQCDDGIECTRSGAKLLIAKQGALEVQVASTTTSITAAQCGSTFVSNSADVMTLPEASTVLGCRLTFVCGTADDFDINPADGTDQISAVNSASGNAAASIAPAAGDAIRCTDIGSSITLEAVGANLWAAIGVGNGAWTDVN